jgi:hypothetical protein
VSIEFAQVAIAEAEPHRRRFPQPRLRKASLAVRDGLFMGRTSRQRPVRDPLKPADVAALGILL